jgi:NAD(P)H-dependent FMN reductase
MTPRRVAVWFDGGGATGLGNIVRSRELATRLEQQGFTVSARPLSPVAAELSEHAFVASPDACDAVVLDVPGNGSRWVAEAQAMGARCVALDYHGAVAPDLMISLQAVRPVPAGVEHLRAAIARNHGILLAAPEYNWSMPGSLKNLIDWLSVAPAPVFKGKSILLFSASPSARGGVVGLTQLRTPLEVLGAFVYPQLIAIGKANQVVTDQGITTHKEAAFVSECLKDFITRTGQLCG